MTTTPETHGHVNGSKYNVDGMMDGAVDTTAKAPTPVNITGQPGPINVSGLLDIEVDFQNAYGTTGFALQHAGKADAYIAKLGELAASLTPPVIEPVFPTNVNAPAISAPVAPDLIPIVYNPPPVPGAFVGSLDVSDLFPTFDSKPPALIFPNAPAPPDLVLPPNPAINTNFAYPTVKVDLPPVPQLLSIQVAQFQGVTFPTLDATAPTLTAIAPSVVAYLPNAPYTDALLSELVTSLKARLDIGNTGTNTGLPPAVEENIWNRGREREAKTLGDSMTALDRMESMGYAFAPGVFIDAQIKLQTEYSYVSMGLSREVMTKQAELEQENIKTALEQSVAIEGKLIDYANQTEQRRFEATKYATEAGISVYNAQVQAYGIRVTAYRAAIDVFTAQMEGAKTIVAVYTAELEAERLKVQANTELVQQYKIQVDAALASIEVFKGEIQIVQTEAQIEQLKVSIFGEQVKAYLAQANVYQAEVEGYKATIEAEQTKEQVYATSTSAYSSLVDATAKEVNAKVEVFKAQLAQKTEEYDAYKAQVEGQAEAVRAIASANQSIAAIYSAQVQGVNGYNDAMVKEWQASIQLAEQVTQIGVSAAQANGQLYLSAQSIATDAAKVGAQVEAQIAASALGAVTWTTHRARTDGVSVSQGNNFGNNKSISDSNSTSSGTSNSVSSSTSNSVSSSASINNGETTVHQISSSE